MESGSKPREFNSWIWCEEMNINLSATLIYFFDAFSIKHDDPRMKIYKKILEQYKLEPIQKQMKYLIENWQPEFGKTMPSLAEILVKAKHEKNSPPMLSAYSLIGMPDKTQRKQYNHLIRIVTRERGTGITRERILSQLIDPTEKTLEGMEAFFRGKEEYAKGTIR